MKIDSSASSRALPRANPTRRTTCWIRTRSTRSSTSSRSSSPPGNPNQSLASKTTRRFSRTRFRRTTLSTSGRSSSVNKLDSRPSTAAPKPTTTATLASLTTIFGPEDRKSHHLRPTVLNNGSNIGRKIRGCELFENEKRGFRKMKIGFYDFPKPKNVKHPLHLRSSRPEERRTSHLVSRKVAPVIQK